MYLRLSCAQAADDGNVYRAHDRVESFDGPRLGRRAAHGRRPRDRPAARRDGSPTDIRWTEAYGGSLYEYGERSEAVEIGLADIGWVGTLWELSKMPLQNVTYYAPFASNDQRTVSRS